MRECKAWLMLLPCTGSQSSFFCMIFISRDFYLLGEKVMIFAFLQRNLPVGLA